MGFLDWRKNVTKSDDLPEVEFKSLQIRDDLKKQRIKVSYDIEVEFPRNLDIRDAIGSSIVIFDMPTSVVAKKVSLSAVEILELLDV